MTNIQAVNHKLDLALLQACKLILRKWRLRSPFLTNPDMLKQWISAQQWSHYSACIPCYEASAQSYGYFYAGM